MTAPLECNRRFRLCMRNCNFIEDSENYLSCLSPCASAYLDCMLSDWFKDTTIKGFRLSRTLSQKIKTLILQDIKRQIKRSKSGRKQAAATKPRTRMTT